MSLASAPNPLFPHKTTPESQSVWYRTFFLVSKRSVVILRGADTLSRLAVAVKRRTGGGRSVVVCCVATQQRLCRDVSAWRREWRGSAKIAVRDFSHSRAARLFNDTQRCVKDAARCCQVAAALPESGGKISWSCQVCPRSSRTGVRCQVGERCRLWRGGGSLSLKA